MLCRPISMNQPLSTPARRSQALRRIPPIPKDLGPRTLTSVKPRHAPGFCMVGVPGLEPGTFTLSV